MLHGLVQEQCSIKGNRGDGKKLHRFIVSPPKSAFSLFKKKNRVVLPVFATDLPTSANHHLFYGVAAIYGNFGMI